MSSKVACLYIRVSTEDQTELSPDAQKRLLLDYAQKNDMIVSGDFIFTESVSGRHAQKRPEFQKMIALAKQPSHPIDVILVWKFSRFARNQEESIVYKSMLKKDNVDVISVSEPLIEGPFGSLIEHPEKCLLTSLFPEFHPSIKKCYFGLFNIFVIFFLS